MVDKSILDKKTGAEVLAYVNEINAKTENEKGVVARLREELQGATPELLPNGIKDISELIWPYQMGTGYLDIGNASNNASAEKNIANNNVAGFVINKIVAQIFEVVPPVLPATQPTLKYIDLSSDDADLIDKIFIKLSDSSSDRAYNTDFFHIAHLGNARFMKKMLSNPFIGPNSGFFVELSSKGQKAYKVCITLVGYRMKIDDNLFSYTTLE